MTFSTYLIRENTIIDKKYRPLCKKTNFCGTCEIKCPYREKED